jgi:hypothetical protein
LKRSESEDNELILHEKDRLQGAFAGLSDFSLDMMQDRMHFDALICRKYQ